MDKDEAIATRKQVLRTQMLAKRRELSPILRKSASYALGVAGQGLIASLTENIPHIIAGYTPFRHEIALGSMLVDAEMAGHSLALPVVISETEMLFRKFATQDKLAKNHFGITEPLASAPECLPDILFLPMLGFNRSGVRLGYGGGYYDRYLHELSKQKNITVIGVAYSFQECPTLPDEAHDFRLDAILTEKEVLWAKRGN